MLSRRGLFCGLAAAVAVAALPFAWLKTRWRGSSAPNETTIEAMKAARRGELVTVGNVEGLFADLHADDEAEARQLDVVIRSL
jgi:hypothetical protein